MTCPRCKKGHLTRIDNPIFGDCYSCQRCWTLFPPSFVEVKA